MNGAENRVVDPGIGPLNTRRLSKVPSGPQLRISPAQKATPAACSAVLSRVDELPEDSTGALVWGDPKVAVGALLIEKGRICWGVARGSSRRLTAILREQSNPPLAIADVERVVRECQKTKVPLGEALVQAELVTPEGLRSALKQQAAEAVARIARSKEAKKKPRFLPHRRQTYDPTYSFSTAEILACIGELQVGSTSLDARELLRGAVQGIASGAAFSREGGITTLLCVEEKEPLSVTEVTKMVVWAQGQLDVASAISPGLKLVSSVGQDRKAIVAWQEADLIFVAVCAGKTDFARVLMAASRR
jgi:hypothetical protein